MCKLTHNTELLQALQCLWITVLKNCLKSFPKFRIIFPAVWIYGQYFTVLCTGSISLHLSINNVSERVWKPKNIACFCLDNSVTNLTKIVKLMQGPESAFRKQWTILQKLSGTLSTLHSGSFSEIQTNVCNNILQ